MGDHWARSARWSRKVPSNRIFPHTHTHRYTYQTWFTWAMAHGICGSSSPICRWKKRCASRAMCTLAALCWSSSIQVSPDVLGVFRTLSNVGIGNGAKFSLYAYQKRLASNVLYITVLYAEWTHAVDDLGSPNWAEQTNAQNRYWCVWNVAICQRNSIVRCFIRVWPDLCLCGYSTSEQNHNNCIIVMLLIMSETDKTKHSNPSKLEYSNRCNRTYASNRDQSSPYS